MNRKDRKYKKTIRIKGARVHNLKNIDVEIPHNEFVVITGLSGSGKSTLAFDTIFAEGQRRYVESLSAYARQFLGRIDKPDVDFITGIAPAIAIEQRVNTRNPRSTVATSTELYDYLRLLYSRIGKTYSPISGREVKMYYVSDIVVHISTFSLDERIVVAAPLNLVEGQGIIEKLTVLVKDGLQRIFIDDKVQLIEDYLGAMKSYNEKKKVYIVIDRVKTSTDNEFLSRLSDSVAKSLSLGDGVCAVISGTEGGEKPVVEEFATRMQEDGIVFEELSEYMFAFNNPLGACPVCEGYGKIVGIDEELVIPDKSKTIYDDAIACWRGETMKSWKEEIVKSAAKFHLPIHKPYYDLLRSEKQLLWRGNEYFHGLDEFFKFIESERYKVQYRVMLSRYTGKTTCPECGGTRLKKEALWVKVNGMTIADLVVMSVDELVVFFANLTLDEYDTVKSLRIVAEIRNRLQYLQDVGLGYLTMDRLSSTLSGGESQRINLSTSLGSNLVGSLYILDEPSIGLHPRDSQRLIAVLKQLRDIGNTVIVVEHEEEIIRAADRIIDIGPDAGYSGGEVVFNGTFKELVGAKNSYTADYFTGKREIEQPKSVRRWSNYIEIIGAKENNLKGFNVKIPLNAITCVTGVSGSGKTSLVKGILYPAIRRELFESGVKPGSFERLEGDVLMLKSIEMVDQNPIGKSSRSNPVTYIKAYDEIRKLYAELPYAKANNMTPSSFSFNIAGGRCDECQGDGTIKIEMQFMADVELKCETCGGKRFKDEVLEVRYHDKSIYDVLEMTIDSAIEFFAHHKDAINKRIVDKLKALQDVGLGYIKMGQSSSTLSGGESQRVKLASFLLKENTSGNMMFIFDEPTTGLHIHDINKLLSAFNALMTKGHTIVIVEHNMDVIKCADWVIDLGPEAGDIGGNIVFEGTPTNLMKCKEGYTGKYLSLRAKQQR